MILLPLFALRFVASPLSYVFYVAEKQHVDLLWQLCLLATTMSALLLPSGYRETLLSYAVGYGFLYVVYIALSYRFSAEQPPLNDRSKVLGLDDSEGLVVGLSRDAAPHLTRPLPPPCTRHVVLISMALDNTIG